MKWMPGRSWSPVKRGVVAALLAWVAISSWYLIITPGRLLPFLFDHDRQICKDAEYASFFALLDAIEKVDRAKVKSLLDAGVDPNTRPPFYDANRYCSPLNLAIAYENKEMVKLLLDHGINPHCGDASGNPLSVATVFYCAPIMDILIRTSGSEEKDKALEQAVNYGKTDSVAFLLSHGADPDQVPASGIYLNQQAMDNGCPAIAQLLQQASTAKLKAVLTQVTNWRSYYKTAP